MEDTQQQMMDFLQDISPLLIDYGMQLLGAIIILIIGTWLSRKFAKKAIKSAQKSGKVDDTLVPIIGNVTRITIMIITILAVLSQFGVQTASVIAVLGAAGLAVGLALQGTLSNVASGVMLLIFRPFKVGDVAQVNGNVLLVDEIGLFMTKLHTFDNINVYLPNSKVWGSEIRNYSQNETRRVDLIMGIGYDDDIDKAMKAIREVIDADERVLAEPEPMLAVESLGDSSVNIMVRCWANTPDWFATKLDLTRALKYKLDEEDITIPYPQRDVHLFEQKK
jgi:small conductance mechanosensitive channel